MNKLLKYILVAIGATSICIASFANAGNIALTINDNNTQSFSISGHNTFCAFITSSLSSNCLDLTYNNNHLTYLTSPGNASRPYCDLNSTNSSKTFTIKNTCGSTKYVWINYVDYSNGYTCPTCPSQYTSLECQYEYSLIPINDVNANYCHVNFGMIDPTECPINEGTGAVNWTPRYINSVQYPGTSLLYINVPEDIAYSVTYNQEETIVDVEGYNADTEYIKNVINNEKLTPTNEDFATMINGLIAFIPYLFIGLLFFRFARILKKIWK